MTPDEIQLTGDAAAELLEQVRLIHHELSAVFQEKTAELAAKIHQIAKLEADLDLAHKTAAQLTGALASRAIIEQAKGIVAEKRHGTPEDAYAVILEQCRTQNLNLQDLCGKIVALHVDPTTPRRQQPTPGEPTHHDCPICSGRSEQAAIPIDHWPTKGESCRLFHKEVEFYNLVTLNGAIYE